MLDMLASWGEFIGGIAVVVSLLYVGSQVRASVKQARIDSYTKIAELMTQWTGSIYSSTDASHVFASGMADFESLSDENKLRFHSMMAMYFGIVDTVMVQEKEGVYLYPETYERHLSMASAFYNQPGVRQWWVDRGSAPPYPHIAEYLERDASLSAE